MAKPPRLSRLERVARLRAVDRLRAVERVASSGQQLDRLAMLAERSDRLLRDYDNPAATATGGMLANHLLFRGRLADLSSRTASDAQDAERQVEAARHHLAAADRRSELVDERLQTEKKALVKAQDKDWHGT